jgi:hypothetical protein
MNVNNTKWTIIEYKKWIRHKRPINNDVLELDISDSCITTLRGIENLPKLEILYSYDNKVIMLEPIQKLANIKELYFTKSKIINLELIQNLRSLEILICSYGRLSSLKGIENLINLKVLECSNNNLINLNNIENLHNLTSINCSWNKLTNLNGIQNLTNLQKLNCSDNKLTNLNYIENLNRLRQIYYWNNPIEHIPPHILRMLDRINNGQNIYIDSENVHNHNIQESIRQSISNILKYKPTITNLYQLIINDPILNEQTKRLLFEYVSCKDIHTTLNVTFEELLLYVFDRIEQHTDKDEIKKILNIEMTDSICKCFTGRISRLINCLNGFDPLVIINISDSEQISQIIIQIGNELNQTNNYDTSMHKQLVRNRLKELMYSNDLIELWIQNIE